MYLMVFFCLLGVFSGFWVFCSTREHLLSSLLSLEYMVLSVFFLFLLSLSSGTYFYSLIYMIMAACEGALGLSVLVMMSRSYGGDYFKSFSLIDFS